MHRSTHNKRKRARPITTDKYAVRTIQYHTSNKQSLDLVLPMVYLRTLSWKKGDPVRITRRGMRLILSKI